MSSLKPLEQFSPDFTWGLLSKGFCQFVQMVPHHRTRWPPCPYMVKILKNLLLRTKKLWSQKLTYVTCELKRDSRGDEREGQGRKREMNKWRNRRNNNIPPVPLPAARTCPTLSQYQLGDPVTKATGHIRLTQPTPYRYYKCWSVCIWCTQT